MVHRSKLFVLSNENQLSFGQNVGFPLQNRSFFGQFTNPHLPSTQRECITKRTSCSVSLEIIQCLQSDRKLYHSLTKGEQARKHFDTIQTYGYDHYSILNHRLVNSVSLRSYTELKSNVTHLEMFVLF